MWGFLLCTSLSLTDKMFKRSFKRPLIRVPAWLRLPLTTRRGDVEPPVPLKR